MSVSVDLLIFALPLWHFLTFPSPPTHLSLSKLNKANSAAARRQLGNSVKLCNSATGSSLEMMMMCAVLLLHWNNVNLRHLGAPNFIYNTFTFVRPTFFFLFVLFCIFCLLPFILFYFMLYFLSLPELLFVCCLRLALSSGNSKSFLMRKVYTQRDSKEAPRRKRASEMVREWESVWERERVEPSLSTLATNLIICLYSYFCCCCCLWCCCCCCCARECAHQKLNTSK